MILVTGAGGTVGSELVKALSAAGAKFRAAYNSPAKVELAPPERAGRGRHRLRDAGDGRRGAGGRRWPSVLVRQSTPAGRARHRSLGAGLDVSSTERLHAERAQFLRGDHQVPGRVLPPLPGLPHQPRRRSRHRRGGGEGADRTRTRTVLRRRQGCNLEWRYGQPGAGGRGLEVPSPRPDSAHASDDTRK